MKKIRRKPNPDERLYVAVGVNEKGHTYLAWAHCKKCGGLGVKGYNQFSKMEVPCTCMKVCELPINWLYLPKKRAA